MFEKWETGRDKQGLGGEVNTLQMGKLRQSKGECLQQVGERQQSELGPVPHPREFFALGSCC